MAHQDGALWDGALIAAVQLQTQQQPAADVPDVAGTFPKVRIVHFLEGLNMLVDGVAERPGGPGALPDPTHHAVDQAVALQHLQIGVEQHMLVRGHRPHQAFGQVLDLLAHHLHGRLKGLHLVFDVHGLAIGHGLQVRGRISHHGGADGNARRPGYTAKRAPPAHGAARQAFNTAAGLAVGDGTGQLRGHGHQKGDLGLLEPALLLLLNHQHPEQATVMHDGHAQEGVKPLLARLREIAVAGMGVGAVQIDGLLALAHQTHQAFVEIDSNPSHRLGIQAPGGHQHVLAAVAVDQIHGAHIHAHGLGHALDDDIQRLAQVAG